MRRLKYYVASTLDGYIATKGGGVDWLFTDADYGMSDFFDTVDTAVMGRFTYDWAMQRDPSGKWGAQMKSYVFSHTMPAGRRGPFEFVADPPAEFLARLRLQDGKDIWLMGGGLLARAFLRSGLVDDFMLAVHPVLLGEGIPLFPRPFDQIGLELVSTTPYPNGLLCLHYRARQVEEQ